MSIDRSFLSRVHPQHLALRLHRDERGALSVMGVFTIFMLTVLLGMIFNMGKQIDDKLRMQNAADAVTYSGTRTVTRGMNAISYSNHLLCEIFALTAYMREARLEPNSTQLPDSTLVAEDVLDVWEEIAQEAFIAEGGAAGLEKFEALGQAILAKVPLERQVVRSFEPLAREHSRLTLSVFEYILRGPDVAYSVPVENDAYPQDALEGGLITEFQRSVVINTPQLAQWVVEEVVERHATGHDRLHAGHQPVAVMYRSDGVRLDSSQAYETDRVTRTLPVIDPTAVGGDVRGIDIGFNPQLPYRLDDLSLDQRYFKLSYDTRSALSRQYLQQLIFNWMDIYFTERRSDGTTGLFGRDRASLSQLANFWRIFTCAQLNKLLQEEFPRSNMPFLIRSENLDGWRYDPSSANANGTISNFHNNVWFDPRSTTDPHSPELHDEYHLVGIVAWTPIEHFAPQFYDHPLTGHYPITFSEAKFFLPYRLLNYPWIVEGEDRYGVDWSYTNTNGWPSSQRDWSMMNQNWRTKLVPASADNLVEILQTHVGPGYTGNLEAPNLSGISVQDIRKLNSH
ncbi:MAG: Tad domain-containing protein [Planctomycetaceae bacterium]|nr:Tad domain-containing protein [Planctomycetaceae bacterium]